MYIEYEVYYINNVSGALNSMESYNLIGNNNNNLYSCKRHININIYRYMYIYIQLYYNIFIALKE